MHQISIKDFPDLDLGNKRREERFVQIINQVANQPGSSIPKQNRSWYDTKATYEFFKDEDVSEEFDNVEATTVLQYALFAAE